MCELLLAEYDRLNALLDSYDVPQVGMHNVRIEFVLKRIKQLETREKAEEVNKLRTALEQSTQVLKEVAPPMLIVQSQIERNLKVLGKAPDAAPRPSRLFRLAIDPKTDEQGYFPEDVEDLPFGWRWL